ncbi:TetR/AcrR family transcriptional regulator [Streptomyces sp. GC420]|uniref:TetR/AcrR family transcriptional regulator n=1 Tax=Streptomyces sp. GC420 TaxID=2697568 RepID=UPI00141508A7|nr:TetR/AcrR family transcriptional regulator [Streptomyces sp. GC420]NBM17683.1 TetR family transcriptional regulator [Streptomyces sp. GC420]
MARVSQEHLDARRRQILDGAARCFARNGFHATSMQDVLQEVGLSAGAVYRYFRGKEQLIAAIADEVFVLVGSAFDDAARSVPPPTPDVLVGRVLRRVFDTNPAGDAQAFCRLVLQVWPETLRNEVLAATLQAGFDRLLGAWSTLVAAYQAGGQLDADIPAEHVARTCVATVQGFLAQQALFGDVDVRVLEDGVRGLMSLGRAVAPDPS